MLRTLALLVSVLHLAAIAFAAAALGPGRSADPLERMAFVSAHPARWAFGWLSFVVAGLALIAFLVVLRRAIDPPRDDASCEIGLFATAVGAALEFAGHFLSMGALPSLGAHASAQASYRAIERTVDLLTAAGGQLGFGLGTLMFTLALRRARAGRVVVAAGFAGVLGSALAIAAALAGARAAADAAIGLVVTSLCVFALGAAYGRARSGFSQRNPSKRAKSPSFE